MKKQALYIGFFALLAAVFVPVFTFADTVTVPQSCSASGYTVVYVNGVFDTYIQALNDSNALKGKMGPILNSQPITVQLGYNPSHLAGLGDLAETLSQMNGSSLTNYDLDTILMQIYPEVTTRKLLIVGHSQGALYGDEMYAYLTSHGEPKAAVNTYSVATPALTLDQGAYVSSDNDSLLNALRLSGAKVLPANIDIPVGADDTKAFFPGHSFVDSYLAGASDRIVSDISGELSALTPTDAGSGDCFTPPAPSIGYQAQTIAFAIADPVAVVTKAGVVAAAQVGEAGVSLAYNFVAGATQFLADTVKITTSPPSQAQATEQTLKVVDKLYGGDLSDPQLQNLLGPGASQGGAVALAVQDEKPVPINGGYVEGTSTEAISATSTQSIFPQTPTGQVWTGGGSPSAPQNSANDSDTDDATPLTTSAPEPFDASTEPPVLSVPACVNSLSADFCFVPTTNITLTWSSVENALQYSIDINGLQTTTTTSTGASVTLADEASSTVQITAFDASSTPLASNTQTIYAFTKPVVINEVAWSGTYNSPNDQWIELKNKTPYTLDATKLTLLAEQGGSQYISLTGTISGVDVTQGFPYLYLLERTQTVFTQVSGSTPQFAGEFDPLTSAGEQLALTWQDGSATTTLDETPAVSTCSGWCAGRVAQVGGYAWAWGGSEPISMERISATVDGTLASNWASNDGYQQNATDGFEQRVVGSPGAPNSNNWPLAGFFCDGDASILTRVSGMPPVYTPQSNHCTVLAGFIAMNDSVGGAIFEGTIGSSTMVQDSSFGSNGPVASSLGIDSNSYPPGQYFVAMWETNNNIGAFLNNTFVPDTISFIETGAQLGGATIPTPLNQIFIPFTYAPQ